MNGIDKITARIAADAQLEVDRIMAEAGEKCQEIKASYDQKAQDEYWRLIREGTADCEVQVKRYAGAAALEAKKNVLAMKQRSVSKVLEVAESSICNLPQTQYVDFLSRLAAEASFTGQEELIFNQRDRQAVGRAVVKAANDKLRKKKLPQSLTLSEKVGDFSGGLIVKQGDIEVNCCVETLINLRRDKLSPQIAEILFAD